MLFALENVSIMMLTVFSLSLLVGFAVGNLGKCPVPKPMEEFDLSVFDTASVWYLIDGFETLENKFRTCTRYTVKAVEGDSKKATGILRYSTIFGEEVVYFVISTPNHSKPYELEVEFDKGHLHKHVTKVTVLAVDDETIILYSCTESILQHFPNIWVLAKTNTIDDKKRLGIYDKIKGWDIKGKMWPIDHKDCPEDQ